MDDNHTLFRVDTGDDGLVSRSPVSNSSSETDEPSEPNKLQRPKLPSRKSSGTIIVPRDDPNIEMIEEEYGPEDARTMSPRRTSEEVDRLGENARQALMEQAKELQESLLQIVERVESVKSEHEKLEGGNRFLQSYIGELMQTSKLTASSKNKGKGKSK
ncbi:hypothetical protein BT63DRAFT_433141 [Microthyrium microscopicum]|uniref:BZIP transcription factor n=1 Tax=Microthyrium microscopicum TaxID=703497 RepID=A0A6A6UA65_9PEZI|nr:hypothetical protein BT63DRAFT_433141 [Microthyrium microscopicum]